MHKTTRNAFLSCSIVIRYLRKSHSPIFDTSPCYAYFVFELQILENLIVLYWSYPNTVSTIQTNTLQHFTFTYQKLALHRSSNIHDSSQCTHSVQCDLWKSEISRLMWTSVLTTKYILLLLYLILFRYHIALVYLKFLKLLIFLISWFYIVY